MYDSLYTYEKRGPKNTYPTIKESADCLKSQAR